MATSRSAAKREAALAMGAAAAIDSSSERWDVRADIVVESVGPATWNQSVRSLKPGGRVVVCGGTSGTKAEINLPVLFFKQYEIIGSSMGSYQEFADITRLMANGLAVHVDEVFGLTDYPAALARMDAGEQLGKIVLRRKLAPMAAHQRHDGPAADRVRTQVNGHPRRLGRPTVQSPAVTLYVPEEFSAGESDILRRYFTNLDGPVFALVNLPEVVKGALFARYSRSPKSLRRLFLDEFVGDLDISGDHGIDATVGLERAEELYERVFFEYGDDSVAQLGGVHLACEQASNILTKVLEWGRLMSYLEQSTRYIAYDARLGGRYRYFRDPAVMASRLGTRYVGEMDRMFDAYSAAVATVTDHVRATIAKDPADTDFVFRQATRAKALDATRGMLPAASLSNVGIYGTGQGFEALLLRLRAHPLPEARAYAELMLEELRKVIPSFLRRVDVPDRGGRWVEYLATTRSQTAALVDELFAAEPVDEAPTVTLVDFDPDAEDKLLAAICYPHSRLSETQLLDRVRSLGADERRALVTAYVGDRENRRHKPGRAFERLDYRFDILSDYGSVPRSATTSSADDRVASADARPRLRATRADRRGWWRLMTSTSR